MGGVSLGPQAELTNPVIVSELVKDLESFNCHDVRKAAALRLGRLGHCDRLVIDSLQRLARDNHSELGKIAQESIDSIYLTDKMKKAAVRPKIMQTTVEITPEMGPGLEVETTRSFCKCNFCGKETVMTPGVRRFTEKLSGQNRFYCTFCLRHKLNHRDARNTLLLTFRGIIGYYYYSLYSLPKHVWMCISEIKDYINMHVEAGLQNPVFIYDPEAYLWFIDFNRIGNAKTKMPIQDVLATIGEILLAFDLQENVKDIKPHKVYHKYEEAILKFYHQRHRPVGSRVLAPTLVKTGAGDYAADKLARDLLTTTTASYDQKRKIPWEDTRNFTPAILNEGLGKKF